jgi:hypothetical protein
MLIIYVVLLPKFCKNFSIPDQLSPFSVITINPDTKGQPRELQQDYLHSPNHSAWQPSTRVSQTLRSSYLSHVITATT